MKMVLQLAIQAGSWSWGEGEL